MRAKMVIYGPRREWNTFFIVHKRSRQFVSQLVDKTLFRVLLPHILRGQNRQTGSAYFIAECWMARQETKKKKKGVGDILIAEFDGSN